MPYIPVRRDCARSKAEIIKAFLIRMLKSAAEAIAKAAVVLLIVVAIFYWHIPWGYVVLAVLAWVALPIVWIVLEIRYARPIPRSWLQERTTVARVEASPDFPSLADRADASGPERRWHEDWLSLLEKMEEGDELWTFDSPLETWQHFCGRAGVAVVRNGKVVAGLITRLN